MATQREIELCQEIFGLAIQINTRGAHSIWAAYRGHINAFNVQISEPWTPNGQIGQDLYIHLSGSGNIPSAPLDCSPDEAIPQLEGVKVALSELLAIGACAAAGCQAPDQEVAQ